MYKVEYRNALRLKSFYGIYLPLTFSVLRTFYNDGRCSFILRTLTVTKAREQSNFQRKQTLSQIPSDSNQPIRRQHKNSCFFIKARTTTHNNSANNTHFQNFKHTPNTVVRIVQNDGCFILVQHDSIFISKIRNTVTNVQTLLL
jgi:hypothetical protein